MHMIKEGRIYCPASASAGLETFLVAPTREATGWDVPLSNVLQPDLQQVTQVMQKRHDAQNWPAERKLNAQGDVRLEG